MRVPRGRACSVACECNGHLGMHPVSHVTPVPALPLCRARVDIAELCGALREMEALAHGQPGLSILLASGPSCADPAAIGAAMTAAGLPAPAAVHAAGDKEDEEEESSADTAVSVGSHRSSLPELQACAASVSSHTAAPVPAASAPLLPWAADLQDAAGRTAPPRRSKKRCNSDALLARSLLSPLASQARHPMPDAVQA